MMTIPRRQFLKTASILGAVAAVPQISMAANKKPQRVVVIGGGFAGATAAKYLKRWSPQTEVVLIERQAQFVSCPQSNLVLSGSRTLQQLTMDYHGLEKYGVRQLQANVTDIDVERHRVMLEDGTQIGYERLILAPGVDFIYDIMPELADQNAIPHAWKAGPQTILLAQQLKHMRQGGVVVMSIPGMPFRCPPGPYERACQIAFFLRHYNPGAKLIVLDESEDIIVKKALFQQAWQYDYQGLIEYIPRSRIDSVDVKTRKIETEFDSFKADVVNIIPPQKAGAVAELAGVVNVDQRWCAVDMLSYESTAIDKVHIIGDAISSNLPKSGHIANQQAKVCAAAVASLLAGQDVEQQPVFSNTCYSFIDNSRAGYIAEVFRYHTESKTMHVMPNIGIAHRATRQDGRFANAWAKNIWSDTLK